MGQDFFIMANKHAESCGEPPVFSNKDSNNYYSYFENDYGEQWVFEYDYTTKTGKLLGGDAGWNNIYTVKDSKAVGILLNDNEALWLKACWSAAISR